ncbi:MAG: PQQ-binding-like beta-propeller repeat protein, partial [Lentisphaerae bacterium]|nr:PQQ-binding-like beta-propeller repeat protein [Lentisphaerota bacterium]
LADGALRGHLDHSYNVVGAKGVVSGGYGVWLNGLMHFGSQNVLHVYKPDGKHVGSWKDALRLVATGDRYIRLAGPPFKKGRDTQDGWSVTAIDRVGYDAGGRKNPVPKSHVQWTVEGSNLCSMIVAGLHVVVGGLNEVRVLEISTGKEVWKGAVEGEARGLAVANGRLVVSTDRGRLHAFGKGAAAPAAAKPGNPFPADESISALAESLSKDLGVKRGYGLVAGGNVRLAYALAKRTGLQMHVLEADPTKAAAARAALGAAGAYGSRVVVDLLDGGTNPPVGGPFPPYFANLVVAEGMMPGVTSKDLLRVLKPCGGVLFTAGATDQAWEKEGKVSSVSLGGKGWSKLVRGMLPGARNWTHQYADAGNTSSSDDDRVRGKPEVLWYGEPGADKAQERHAGAQAPLSFNGRVFSQGLQVKNNAKTHLLLSFDAYNGAPYWERELPGAERLAVRGDCGNMACSEDGLFVAAEGKCHRLDLATGETRATYAAPERAGGSGGAWAYVAVEGNRLVGSVSSANQFSDTVFAIDVATGKQAWKYDGAVIRNSTLAIEGGRVYFVEHRGGAKAKGEKDSGSGVRGVGKKGEEKKEGGKKGEEADEIEGPISAEDAVTRDRDAMLKAPSTNAPEPCLRTVVALDLATGKELWAKEVDVAGFGGWNGNQVLIAKKDVLLICGTYTAYGKASLGYEKRRGLALSAKDGSTLWNEAIANVVRPVVVGDRIIARPKAFELATGKTIMRPGGKEIPWATPSGGACGLMSASSGMLFFRDGSTMIRDAVTGGTLMAFVGMRPGCLINVIPAGGVAVQVEGSSGCICQHALQGTVTFVPQNAE